MRTIMLEAAAAIDKAHAEAMDAQALRIEKEQGAARQAACEDMAARHAQDLAVHQAEILRFREEAKTLNAERDENRATIKSLREQLDASERRVSEAETKMAEMAEHPEVKSGALKRVRSIIAELQAKEAQLRG